METELAPWVWDRELAEAPATVAVSADRALLTACREEAGLALAGEEPGTLILVSLRGRAGVESVAEAGVAAGAGLHLTNYVLLEF